MVTALTLYEHEERLLAAHEQLSASLEDPEVPAPDDLVALIEEYLRDAIDKRDACAAFDRRIAREIDGIEAEITRLQKIAAVRLAARATFRKHIKAVMEGLGRDRMEGMTSKFSLQANPRSVSIDNIALLPEQYVRARIVCALADVPTELRERVTLEADKAALLPELKEGKVVAGASLEPETKRLVIR